MARLAGTASARPIRVAAAATWKLKEKPPTKLRLANTAPNQRSE